MVAVTSAERLKPSRQVQVSKKEDPWSTPVREYKDFGGRRLPSYGEAVWHTPEGEFRYGQFTTVEIAYNLKELR